jgi:hypothetical protein
MKALLLLILIVVLLGGGFKMAGVRLPLLDYPVGPIGINNARGVPEVHVEAPGFDDLGAP